MSDLASLSLVLVGGGIGSILRWSVGLAVLRRYSGTFPVGTFLINVSGCFAIGLLSTVAAIAWQDRLGTAFSALVLTGILGGYTTFSSYELDAYGLATRRDGRGYWVYWAGSILAGLVAASIGHVLGDALVGTP